MKPCECPGRYIPEPIKRDARHRCGFGCIFCGNPIIEYHHIEEWHKVKKHEAHNITLLCDGDHRRVGAGLISRDQVIKRNKSPYNRQVGRTPAELLRYEGNHCVMNLGSRIIFFGLRGMGLNGVSANRLCPLSIRGRAPLSFRFENGQLLLHADILDRRGNFLLQILDNELSFTTEGWDATFVANRLKIISSLGETRLELEFQPPDSLTVVHAELFCEGLAVRIDDNGLTLPDFPEFGIADLGIEKADVAFAFGALPPGSLAAGMRFEVPQRPVGGPVADGQ